MTWIIRGLELPQDPTTLSKKTKRVHKPTATEGNYPDLSINQVTTLEMTITGICWPRSFAQALDEVTKNPDGTDVPVSITEEFGLTLEQAWISGLYTVTSSTIERKKPIYTRVNGLDVEVYDYNITFAKFADQGTDQDAVEASSENDENTGFLDMDADDDGKIDLEGIYNFLTSIFTWGASDPV